MCVIKYHNRSVFICLNHTVSLAHFLRSWNKALVMYFLFYLFFCCNLQRIKKGAVLNWCSPSSSERSGNRIKHSPLHPLLNALHSFFFNVQCFIDPPEVCSSHSTFNVMKHVPDKIWSVAAHSARVVYWAPSQRRPPGRTIKLHRYAALSVKTRC